MPYGYYEFVRVFAFVVFIYLAYKSKQEKSDFLLVLHSIGALLFNPIFTVALGRDIWRIVDVIYAILLVYSIIKERLKSV